MYQLGSIPKLLPLLKNRRIRHSKTKSFEILAMLVIQSEILSSPGAWVTKKFPC